MGASAPASGALALDRRREVGVVEAIRDQWLIVAAVVIVVGLVAWLWRAQRRGT